MIQPELLDPFYNYLNKFSKISEEDFRLIAKYIRIVQYGRKAIITRKGETENHVYFILKGLVRKYYTRYKQEFNTQISYEGHLIHSQESFHSRKPSSYIVETIEPSTLISIHYDDLEKIYRMAEKFEHLGRLIITHTMVLKDRWRAQLTELPSKERFINFLNKHPEMLQRVPQKFLASYLNIRPETFSRLKHLMQTNKSRKEF